MRKVELVEINGVDVEFSLVDDSKFTVSSLDVAKVLGKEHDYVIEKIEKISNYMDSRVTKTFDFVIKLSKYSDKNGEMRKSYLIDKDVFSLLELDNTCVKTMNAWWLLTDAFNKVRDRYLKELNEEAEELKKEAEELKAIIFGCNVPQITGWEINRSDRVQDAIKGSYVRYITHAYLEELLAKAEEI